MDQTARSTVLITGATSGIGRELSIVFASHHYDLVLVARTEKSLEQLAEELQSRYPIHCAIIPTDLSNRCGVTKISETLLPTNTRIDILVNNAGFGNWGRFVKTELPEELDEIQVNITSLVMLTKLILPGMIQRGSGKILNVASTAGFTPGPYMAIYYATKAFVVSFSQALREETKGSGVTVSTLCPGETITNFQSRAGIERTNLMRKWFVMDADEVARCGFKGLMKGKSIIIPGLKNKLVIFAIRVGPTRIVRAVAAWFNKKR